MIMEEASRLRREAERDGVGAYLAKPKIRARANPQFLQATVRSIQQCKCRRSRFSSRFLKVCRACHCLSLSSRVSVLLQSAGTRRRSAVDRLRDEIPPNLQPRNRLSGRLRAFHEVQFPSYLSRTLICVPSL